MDAGCGVGLVEKDFVDSGAGEEVIVGSAEAIPVSCSGIGASASLWIYGHWIPENSLSTRMSVSNEFEAGDCFKSVIRGF